MEDHARLKALPFPFGEGEHATRRVQKSDPPLEAIRGDGIAVANTLHLRLIQRSFRKRGKGA